jgi:hypothetical protein
MTAKIIKVVGWAVGMTVGVFLITDGKTQSDHPWQHALIGAAIGLILGIIFSRKLGTKAVNYVQLLERGILSR